MKKKFTFLIMMIILIIPSTIFAFADELIDNPTPSVPEDIGTMASTVLGVIQWAGYAIAVGMLLYIGIKYIMSAANERANLKQGLINWVIGAIIVAGVTTIFTGIVNFITAEQVSKEINAADEDSNDDEDTQKVDPENCNHTNREYIEIGKNLVTGESIYEVVCDDCERIIEDYYADSENTITSEATDDTTSGENNTTTSEATDTPTVEDDTTGDEVSVDTGETDKTSTEGGETITPTEEGNDDTTIDEDMVENGDTVEVTSTSGEVNDDTDGKEDEIVTINMANYSGYDATNYYYDNFSSAEDVCNKTFTSRHSFKYDEKKAVYVCVCGKEFSITVSYTTADTLEDKTINNIKNFYINNPEEHTCKDGGLHNWTPTGIANARCTKCKKVIH